MHKHEYKQRRVNATVKVCHCGDFKFVNLDPENVITEVRGCNQDHGIRGEDHYPTGNKVIVTDGHGSYEDYLCTKCCDRAKANGCEVRNA